MHGKLASCIGYAIRVAAKVDADPSVLSNLHAAMFSLTRSSSKKRKGTAPPMAALAVPTVDAEFCTRIQSTVACATYASLQPVQDGISELTARTSNTEAELQAMNVRFKERVAAMGESDRSFASRLDDLQAQLVELQQSRSPTTSQASSRFKVMSPPLGSPPKKCIEVLPDKTPEQRVVSRASPHRQLAAG